jgi:hypothetical protein
MESRRCGTSLYCGMAREPMDGSRPSKVTITEQEALAAFGPDAVYYATRLRGASNEKPKRELNFRPRPLEWLPNSAG